MYDMVRGNGNWICGPDTIRLLPLGGFVALFPMWLVMMAAMMFPSLVPTLKTYDDLRGKPGATGAGWLGVILGYAIVWILGSAGFAGLQSLALDHYYLDMTGVVSSEWLAAALLACAGLYQFTRTKELCQDACLTPMQYFLAHWRPDGLGGLRMGLGIGGYCVGCCWAIMSLAFVGGPMSLLWMGVATLFMVLEKLPDIGRHLRRPAGGILCVLCLFTIMRAIV